jgi:structural maintenance of chromosome 1
LKDTNTDYDKALKNQRDAAAAFHSVKTRRASLFNEAFNHIDTSLKTIYTDMTKSSKHPLGGNAYLSLDDTEEPYKGGMKFNAMPPMKRFRDMEQLSGGEKTVAALSLLFAIHSYHPAPFFVMDEVDAALDNSKCFACVLHCDKLLRGTDTPLFVFYLLRPQVNLRKVCNYISHRSQEDFQCIVISLKDMFYERSQSLVGVCRDVPSGSSRTLTLDLTQYDKKEEEKKPKGKKRKAKSEGDAKGSKRRSTRSTRGAVESDGEEVSSV